MPGVKWTPEEDDVLRADYAALGARALAARLGRPTGSVSARAWGLGLVYSRANVPALWTPDEDAVVRERWAHETAEAIAARLPGRTVDGVTKRARLLKLESKRWGTGRRWTEQDLKSLQWQWGVMRLETLVKKYNRTPAAIRAKALELGLGAPGRGLVSIAQLAEQTGYDRKRIVNAMRFLNMTITVAPTWTVPKGKIRRTGIDEERAARVIEWLGTYPDAKQIRQPAKNTWTVFECCVRCERTDSAHVSKGLCRRCVTTASWSKRRLRQQG